MTLAQLALDHLFEVPGAIAYMNEYATVCLDGWEPTTDEDEDDVRYDLWWDKHHEGLIILLAQMASESKFIPQHPESDAHYQEYVIIAKEAYQAPMIDEHHID